VLLAACSVSLLTSCGEEKDESLSDVIKSKKLVVGMTESGEPLAFTNPSAKFTGMGVEFAEEIARRLGATAEIKVYKDSELISALTEGEIDCIFCYVVEDRQTELLIEKSDVVFERNIVAATFNNGDLTRLFDLKGKAVSVVGGSFAETVLDATSEFKASLSIVNTESSVEDGLVSIRSGRSDALIIEEYRFKYLTKAFGEIAPYGMIEQPLRSDGYVIAFPKGDKAIQSRVNSIQELMWTDGSLDALMNKWLKE
jgi:polar amino acid transport system substrate-binding protein